MVRKIKTRAGGRWTEARYFSFIRSALRRASTKWPPMYDCKNKARRVSQSSNPRLKWEYQCAECKDWFPDKEVQIDHTVPAGTLTTLEDLPGFVDRLLCEEHGYKVLCKNKCHYNKTQEERNHKTKDIS
jgi:hypothetical protein